jgi:hypothetical protein
MLLLSVSLHVDGLEVDPLEGACKVGSVVGSGSPGSSMGAREESVVSGRADVCLESFVALDMETDVDLPQGHNSLYLSQDRSPRFLRIVHSRGIVQPNCLHFFLYSRGAWQSMILALLSLSWYNISSPAARGTSSACSASSRRWAVQGCSSLGRTRAYSNASNALRRPRAPSSSASRQQVATVAEVHGAARRGAAGAGAGAGHCKAVSAIAAPGRRMDTWILSDT